MQRVQERVLWSELPEVATCGILDEISPEQRLLQESIFEILTSEVSLGNSLRILRSVFLQSNQFTSQLSPDELKIIAGNVEQSEFWWNVRQD